MGHCESHSVEAFVTTILLESRSPGRHSGMLRGAPVMISRDLWTHLLPLLLLAQARPHGCSGQRAVTGGACTGPWTLGNTSLLSVTQGCDSSSHLWASVPPSS